MSVELKVTLVGDDPEQQEAFNNPRTATESATTMPQVPTVAPAAVPLPSSQVEPNVTATPVTQQPVPPTAATPQPEPQEFTDTRDTADKSVVTPPPFRLPEGYVQPPPISEVAMQLRLINTLEALIDAIDRQTAQPNRSGGDKPEEDGGHAHGRGGMFDRFAQAVDRRIDDFGMLHSHTGRMISHFTHTVTDVADRLTKFGAAATNQTATAAGHTAQQAAQQAATGAATQAAAGGAGATATTVAGAGAGAAAGGAAAGAGATAGTEAVASGLTTAAASLTGPLIAAGLMAGAFAFTLKKLVDTIENAANELEDLSPSIAIGRAQHEVTMELKRLDRAQRIGDDVAGVDHARHRIHESMYELQTKMYELMLKASPVLELGLNKVNTFVAHLNVMAAGVEKIISLMTFWDQDDDKKADAAVNKAALDLAEAWRVAAGGHDHGGGFDPFLIDFMNMTGDPNPPPKRGGGHH